MFEKKMNPKIVCADGFTISIQASDCHYCTPRDNQGPYTEVECGFPSRVPATKALREFAENPANYTKTVYGYVPVDIVMAELESHGGIIPDTKKIEN